MKENLNLLKFIFGTTILLFSTSKAIISNAVKFAKTKFRARLYRR